MTPLDLTMIAALVITFGILVSGPVRNNKGWFSTVTPLASILGSGFEASVPLLASAIGIWAVAAGG